MAIFQSVLSMFGVKQPATPAPAPTPPPPQPINYDEAEKKLLPLAFFDTDDILIYTIQALDRNINGCRTFSECAINDSRIIESVIRLLNPKDPVIGFLLEITDELKEAQKSNPIDLDSIAQAFRKAKFSGRLKLESQDEQIWERIESQKERRRQTPVPPRVANAQTLIKTYNANPQRIPSTTPTTSALSSPYRPSNEYNSRSSYNAPSSYGSSNRYNSATSGYGSSNYGSSSKGYGNSSSRSSTKPSSQRYAEAVY